MGLLQHPFTYCVIAALGFGIWPVGARLSRLPSDWSLVLLSIGALIAVLIPFRPATMPSWQSMGTFTFMGVIPNAIGLICVGVLIGWKGQDISKWVVTLNVMMPIVTACASAWLLGEPISLQKATGIGVILIGVGLLSTS